MPHIRDFRVGERVRNLSAKGSPMGTVRGISAQGVEVEYDTSRSRGLFDEDWLRRYTLEKVRLCP